MRQRIVGQCEARFFQRLLRGILIAHGERGDAEGELLQARLQRAVLATLAAAVRPVDDLPQRDADQRNEQDEYQQHRCDDDDMQRDVIAEPVNGKFARVRKQPLAGDIETGEDEQEEEELNHYGASAASSLLSAISASRRARATVSQFSSGLRSWSLSFSTSGMSVLLSSRITFTRSLA